MTLMIVLTLLFLNGCASDSGEKAVDNFSKDYGFDQAPERLDKQLNSDAKKIKKIFGFEDDKEEKKSQRDASQQ
jgi:hypothetical protein